MPTIRETLYFPHWRSLSWTPIRRAMSRILEYANSPGLTPSESAFISSNTLPTDWSGFRRNDKDPLNRCFLRRFAPVLLIIAMALMAGIGCSRLNATPAELIAEAKDHINQGDYDRARIELLNALQKNPNVIEARRLLAVVSLELGDGARAQKEIRKAMALGLSRADAQPILVRTLSMLGKPEAVISETDKPVPGISKAQQAIVLGLRGQALLAKERPGDAQQALEHALSLDDKAPQALVGMAMLHAAQRQYDKANHFLDLAIKAKPSFADAWSARGDLDLLLGKAADAEKAFSRAIEERHYPSMDLAKRALVRTQLGKFQDAQADIDNLKKLGARNDPFVNYAAGVNYFYQKKYNDALLAFQESAANTQSPFLPTQIFLATTHLVLGNTEQALSDAKSAYLQSPDSLAAARLMGAVQMRRSEFGAAEAVLDKALRESPKDENILRMLTTTSLLQGETVKAVKYAKEAESLNPDSDQNKNMLMLAKLMDGQPSDVDPTPKGEAQRGTDNGDRNYTREFLKAATAFRDNKIQSALERAQKLHERYPDKADPVKLMAACHLALGEWDEAKVDLEQALKIAPDDLSSVVNLAKVELQQNNPQRTRTLLKGVLDAHPGNEEVALLLASANAKLGDAAAAVVVLTKVLSVNQDALRARAMLAAEYLRAGQLNDVLQLTAGLSNEEFQKRPELLEVRGKAQMLLGDTASATATFKRWTVLAPDSAESHFLYGDSLARTGKSDLARKELNQAVELDPNYLPARIGQVKMLALDGKTAAAEKALAEVKKQFGEQAEVLGIEGWLALNQKDYAIAANRFTAAQKQKPSTELTLYLVQSLWAEGEKARAVDVMRAWLKDNPKDVLVWLKLAGAYLSLNEEDQAIESYARVVAIYPNHVPSLNNLAWLYRDKDTKKALRYAETAYKLAPEQATVLDTMGILLVKSGDTARGVKMLRTAADGAPGDTEIRLHLGEALIQAKEYPEARDILNKLVGADPKSPFAAKAKELLASIKDG